MTTNHDIFDTFIAAKQALDELPAVKTALEQARQETEMVYHELSVASDDLKAKISELESLKGNLHDKEVALADATFRETVATRKLDTLRGILGCDDNAGPQPALTVSTDTPTSGVETPTPSVNEPSTIDHFQPSDAVAAKTAGVESDKGQSEAGPTATIEQPLDLHTAFESQTVSSDTANNMDVAKDIDPAPEVAAEMGELNGNTSDSASPVATSSIGETPNEFRPYSAQPYWNKPDDMDWSRWTTLGGDPAPWMKEAAISSQF